MSGTLVGYFYLISAVLFILALKGLSNPETARRGNLFGIIGMVIAVIATAFHPAVDTLGLLLGALVIGGAIGAVLAQRVAMTAMPVSIPMQMKSVMALIRIVMDWMHVFR